jgi:hypothetical protein
MGEREQKTSVVGRHYIVHLTYFAGLHGENLTGARTFCGRATT